MSLRVIAGSAKGRRLKLVPGDSTRPIMDKVKEALFSILGRGVIGATFLDLYAGTGSVGIEALSRGAQQAVFVERDKFAVQTIQANLAITDLGEKAVIRRSDVQTFLSRPGGSYDYIFIAPPQYKDLWLETLKTLDTYPAWMDEDTSVIVQIDPTEHKDVTFTNLQEVQQRRYGKTLLWFFSRKPEETDEKTDEPSQRPHS